MRGMWPAKLAHRTIYYVKKRGARANARLLRNAHDADACAGDDIDAGVVVPSHVR
jgi:hypothetical protein